MILAVFRWEVQEEIHLVQNPSGKKKITPQQRYL